jgi:prolyl 4-hydroxylase
MSKRRPDATWEAWVKENRKRKADPELVLGAMIDNHFTRASIMAAMGKDFPAGSLKLRAFDHDPDYAGLAAVNITRADHGLSVEKFDDKRIQLYVVENMLTDAECEAIEKIISRNLRPSTITDDIADKKYRTSRTCDLGYLKLKMVAAVDEKIARALGVRPAYSETIQGQRYDTGQEYKEHTDYFANASPEVYAKLVEKMGDRTWTFMVYLNDVEKGGGTHFTRLKKTFMPKKGRALVWNNLDAEGVPNFDTQHAGLPVEAGHKSIITKWFREKGKGPMFY